MSAVALTALTMQVLLFGQQQPPVPQPFPRPGSQQPAQPQKPAQPPPQPPASSAATKPAQTDGAPTEATLGVPVYPGAQFIASYDAGRGQRFYIFGSAAPFVDLVTYYRTTLKQKGELVFDVPATHEFDVGRYNEDNMAFPPGVTIKDFQSDVSEGYPNPKPNGQPARFKSIIQIVPVAPAR
jgi:hypothetical protein